MTNSSENVERRKSFRLDMEKELVDIFWTDEKGQEHNKQIVCVDFSRGGLKLDCDQDLPVNTAVTVVFKSENSSNQKLYGKVLRSIENENACFEIGLILNDDT
jgi:c-di-GMP-binding flagellar brake protein YcgR